MNIEPQSSNKKNFQLDYLSNSKLEIEILNFNKVSRIKKIKSHQTFQMNFDLGSSMEFRECKYH